MEGRRGAGLADARGDHGASGRSIRRLNAIVVNALMIGAQQQASHIDSDMVFSAAQEVALS